MYILPLYAEHPTATTIRAKTTLFLILIKNGLLIVFGEQFCSWRTKLTSVTLLIITTALRSHRREQTPTRKSFAIANSFSYKGYHNFGRLPEYPDAKSKNMEWDI